MTKEMDHARKFFATLLGVDTNDEAMKTIDEILSKLAPEKEEKE